MVHQKVLIGVITGEYARLAVFYDYFHLLDKPEGTYTILAHDASPANGRNLIIEAAKENKCTHILFIDDDMAYKPDSLKRLLAHDKDIVSGLYFSRAYPHTPLAFDIASSDGSAMPMYMTPGLSGLQEIVAAGFGFCLVKTSVFDKLEKPYIRLGEMPGYEDQWCDDIGFFNRVRKAGIQPYVDLDCKIGHMGNVTIWPNANEHGEWLTGYDTKGSGMVNTPQFNTNYKYKAVEDLVIK